LADLFAIFKSIRAKLTAGDKTAVSDARQVRETYGLLGLFKANPSDVIAAYEEKNKQDVPDEVMNMASARLKAKQEKNWAEADRLRAEIIKLGYAVKDTKEGFVVEKLS
ncbi:MAG: hypothetical protein K2G31_01635, partial [Clostridia bacterium]|nr:hypothetical protein [Clostridia bacterium]